MSNFNEPEIDEEASAVINRHIENYTALFSRQVEEAKGWPRTFRCPEPADDFEREALRLFVEEIESGTGNRITITHI